jgi:hypothetical protein
MRYIIIKWEIIKGQRTMVRKSEKMIHEELEEGFFVVVALTKHP